jgi:hypothetical protein
VHVSLDKIDIVGNVLDLLYSWQRLEYKIVKPTAVTVD